jgi:hypothetical protein
MRTRAPLLALASATALLVGLWLLREPPPSSRRFSLSPQQCNTECQRRQTDCILACDGNVPCERRCTETGEACVQRCLQAADAGAAGAGGRGGAGGAAGRPRP